MNKDIRLSVKFFDHPKTIKLERRLGFPGVKALMRLWMWAALNRPEGDLGDDAEDIEIAAQWGGEPGIFSKVLVDLRWLDIQEGRYSLHDWTEHNPWAAKDASRSDKARFSRMAKTHPEICKALRERGVDEISAVEFEKLTKNNGSLAKVTNRCCYVTNRSAPAPAPAPAPKPETDMVVVVGDCRASAREEPPPPPPKVSAVSPTEAETGFRVVTETWNAICGPLGIERLSDPGDWSEERRDRAWWLWGKAAKRNPEKIREVCEYVVSCPRLIGKSPPGKGYTAPWVVDFDWLMRPENFQKFREGHFAPRGEAHA